jgi:hypothetical protein
VTTEKLQYWYRLYPAAAGSANGIVCNAPWQTTYPPATCIQDEVFVTGLVKSLPATITVQIGNNGASSFQATKVGLNHFSQPFNGQTGAVTIKILHGSTAAVTGTGAAIQANPPNGIQNYNAWVGSA